jgi:2,3-bisphosphoglycerate-dependent phosphoglycerate mutase
VTRAVWVVFETHSLTLDNERGIATGWLGGELSPRGRVLAAELGRRRCDDGLEVVLVSDLARAVETAELAFAGTGLQVGVDRRLREVDYGDWNGAPVELIERERAARVDEPFPGGESYREAAARVIGGLRELCAGHAGGRVLVIGHTATRWALDHVVERRDLAELVVEPFSWREGWEYVLELPSPEGGSPFGAPAEPVAA